MIRIAILACLVAAMLVPAMAVTDISGNWEFTVDTSSGSGNPTFVFHQDGEKLTGTYNGILGEAALTGTVKEDDVRFAFEADYGGQKVKVVYSGKILTPTSMKGTAEYGDLGSGEWTAKKK
jgi:hypothetical protein